jgi:hypothetical protein
LDVIEERRELETNTKEKAVDTNTMSIDLDWQVGSKTPPRVCLCCGFPFDKDKRSMLGPYFDAPYIYICKECHDRDYLHCPDKSYGPVDLKVVAENMKKSLKSARNENILTQTLSLTTNPESAKIENLPGFANFEGKKIDVPLRYIRLADLKLDPDNVRFRHIGQDLADRKLEEMIWKDPSTVFLYKDIRNTKGVIEPLFINANNVVIEGNRRLACLRRLAREIRNDMVRGIPVKYIDPVPCRVISDALSEADKDEFLARIHVGGKKPWRTLDQAFQLHELVNKHGRELSVVSEMTGLTEKAIKDAIRAYELTSEYHRRHPRDADWVSKYSYFFELNKKITISKWIANKKNVRKVMKWIATGQIEKGDEIRRLHSLVNNRGALLKMNKRVKLKDALLQVPKKPHTSANMQSRQNSKLLKSFPKEEVAKNNSPKSQQYTLDDFFSIADKVLATRNSAVNLNTAYVKRLESIRHDIDSILNSVSKPKNVNSRKLEKK